jgi:carbon monoxide dehydrogenase subunit G
MGSRISGRSALSSLAATAATVAINGYGVGAVGAANLNLNNAVRLGSAGSQGAVIIHEYF